LSAFDKGLIIGAQSEEGQEIAARVFAAAVLPGLSDLTVFV
jgi:hypothetical protein